MNKYENKESPIFTEGTKLKLIEDSSISIEILAYGLTHYFVRENLTETVRPINELDRRARNGAFFEE